MAETELEKQNGLPTSVGAGVAKPQVAGQPEEPTQLVPQGDPYTVIQRAAHEIIDALTRVAHHYVNTRL